MTAEWEGQLDGDLGAVSSHCEAELNAWLLGAGVEPEGVAPPTHPGGCSGGRGSSTALVFPQDISWLLHVLLARSLQSQRQAGGSKCESCTLDLQEPLYA